MKASAFGLAALLAATGTLEAQSGVDTTRVPRLFREESPLAVTLTANFGKLRGDRTDDSPYRWAQVSYADGDSNPVIVPLRVKTHGIWRLRHCDLPPLRFNIGNKGAKGTLFHDLQKPKLVSACHDDASYEQLLLRELQLYRIYQVLTPVSHRARLLRISYADSATKKVETTRYAFLFEDPDELADRLGGRMLKSKGAGSKDLDPAQAAIAYMFEYMIGNTDFSFNGLHNGELVMKPDASPLLAVGYDFDFSGAVNAPYATVDPRLRVKRVRDRLYRGYCILNGEYPAISSLWLGRRSRITALYHDPVGKLLDPAATRETLAYFDEFYDLLASERDAKSYIYSGCIQ